MHKHILYTLISIAALLMAGCKERAEVAESVTLPLSITLPASETHAAAHAPQRRVPGDPGTTERFLLPQHIYYFVTMYADDEWKVMYTLHSEPTSEQWIKRRYSGTLQTDGDSIYEYTEHINLMMSYKRTDGQVYAIASAVPLTFNKSMSAVRSMDDLLTLTFDASSTTVQQNLQHIYTSPYNYKVNGSYYGAFSTIGKRAQTMNLMLYHVAAKVDIKWNVVDTMRINLSDPAEAVRLTYMDARRLYNGNAYCFKPLRNTVAELPSSGYDIHIVTPTDEGLWWEGRAYFYTIPYTVEGEKRYFPLQMLMRTNGTSGTGYQLTLNQPIDTTAAFVPWLRGNFNLTKPLEDKSETKTAN